MPLPKPFRKRGAKLQQARLAGFLPQDIALRGHTMFSGVYNLDQIRLAGGRFGDLRDWAAIDAWADDIAARLATPVSPTTPGNAAA